MRPTFIRVVPVRSQMVGRRNQNLAQPAKGRMVRSVSSPDVFAAGGRTVSDETRSSS